MRCSLDGKKLSSQNVKLVMNNLNHYFCSVKCLDRWLHVNYQSEIMREEASNEKL